MPCLLYTSTAGIVGKSGAWYTLGDVRIGQGRERARAWLEQRPELMERLRTSLVSGAPKLGDLGPPESWDNEAPPPEPDKLGLVAATVPLEGLRGAKEAARARA